MEITDVYTHIHVYTRLHEYNLGVICLKSDTTGTAGYTHENAMEIFAQGPFLPLYTGSLFLLTQQPVSALILCKPCKDLFFST